MQSTHSLPVEAARIMKLYQVFLYTILSMAVAQRGGAIRSAYPSSIKTAAPAPLPSTLAQDLKELKRLIPRKAINHLIRRYLLNDAEFQTVVRIINSHDAFVAIMRWRSQPELTGLRIWLRAELKLTNDDSSSEEDSDSIEVHLFNKSPYWSNTVNGWQGFVQEFLTLYPASSVRQYIRLKVVQSAAFAEFWHRVGTLQTAFERFITLPETQRVIAQLQAAGVDTLQLEHFIRTQLDWDVAETASTTEVL